ncbi:uncharacterized protein EI90DRAFT_3151212 [Cantharellus anzutake]|uniref:uncharacterized protein n=1 Tax=Cantharellus anzutake TaxID=1750568 RepID=UPI00190611AE|nr:uncharacterized protein EI90DRAFT_3151212 [Cantharellus anzutake]KAF8339751.1 hypothetical protein EI90DRAFT_3151212 [Cantharellus anzutake]
MNYPGTVLSSHPPLHQTLAPPMDFAAYGGSLPGPDKTLEQAHQENLIKYRKLKARYMEMEIKWKETSIQLDMSQQQSARLKDERTALLDRIAELEALVSQMNGGAPMSSSAFPRGFQYARPLYINGSTPPDLTSLAKVLEEDDTDEDPRKTSRFANERLRRRDEEGGEIRKVEEERPKRASKRPRVQKGASSAPPPNQSGASSANYGSYDSGLQEEQDFYHHQPPPHPGTGTITFSSQNHS